jgi:hypothetical protein
MWKPKEYLAICHVCDGKHAIVSEFVSFGNVRVVDGEERGVSAHRPCIEYARALWFEMTGSDDGFDGREIERPWLAVAA